jgi:inosine-uridine nucleoside N-ribohydrolase
VRKAFFLAALLLALPFLCAHAQSPLKVIIDTDVAMGYPGHDVDDGLLLIIALNSPELEILGVTAAWGNYTQDKTFKKAKEIVAAAGRTDVPCFSGAAGPEDLGRETPASRFIAETVLAHPGEVSIVAVGTLTNVATALLSDPKVAPSIKLISSMGGTQAPPGKWPFWAMIDLNYGADLKSTRTVIESGAPFRSSGSALCFQTIVTPERYHRMVTEAPNMREMIAAQTRLWYRLNMVISPKPSERGFVPWDVTALAGLMHPEWFHDNRVKAELDDKGWGKKTVVIYQSGLPEGQGDFNAPDRIVSPEAFWEWFFQRI